jgi:cytoskeletal protein RodZ
MRIGPNPRGARRASVESAGIGAGLEPLPPLPERLLAARERKGVDLFRAERDTKIRARYLAALERGEWRELPGAVYTKGFLRNYALYLGLDPEEILLQWHQERRDPAPGEAAIVVPRAIEAPRPGITITPGVFAGVLLALAVGAFALYLGMQLFRFAKPPSVEVTDPSVATVSVDESTSTYVLRGTASPGASITVIAPGRDAIRGNVDADGFWAIEVELRRGRNQFKVSVTDPETGKQAEAASTLYITVPFPVVLAPTLTVDQPSEGATFENGAIPVQGTVTNATSVSVTATWLGPIGAAASAAPSASPGSGAGPSEAPNVSITPADDGSFSAPVELTAGRWNLTITAIGAGEKKVSISRAVTVSYQGVSLVVTITGGKAWVKVWVDGVVDPSIGTAGKVFSAGKVLTFIGKESVEVRSGSSGSTYFSLNGTDLGTLGPVGVPQTWLFGLPPQPPVQTQRR